MFLLPEVRAGSSSPGLRAAGVLEEKLGAEPPGPTGDPEPSSVPEP